MSRKRSVLPSDASQFRVVVEKIHTDGRPAGWSQARDIILNAFPVFSESMGGAYQALKAAIEVDRHAMFAEVAAEKEKGRFEAGMWNQFQDYLAARTDEVPNVGTGVSERVPRVGVATVDTPDQEDDEEEEDGG